MMLKLLLILVLLQPSQEAVLTGSHTNSTDCVLPTIPAELSSDANPITANYTFGDVISFSCQNESWTLIGQNYITCSETGQWDADVPKCKYITCDIPEIPAGGRAEFTGNHTVPGAAALFSCQDGLTLQGHTRAMCNLDGTWDPPQPPRCLVSCGPLATIFENGSVHVDCEHENCSAIYVCHSGYKLKGHSLAKCNHDGKWLPYGAPNCTEVVCSEPPSVLHATLLPSSGLNTNYSYGSIATYVCAENTTLHGNESLRCGTDGMWTGAPPMCKESLAANVSSTNVSSPNNSTDPEESPSQCADPETVEHGQYHIYGKFVMYKCEPHYVRIGAPERECQDNMTWSGESPKCSPEPTMAPAPTPDPNLWKHVFAKHKEWDGVYFYFHTPTKFKLLVLATRVKVSALFMDKDAKFDIEGKRVGESIVFEMTKLIEESDRFRHQEKWRFKGDLVLRDGQWKFDGVIDGRPEFERITMRPVTLRTPGDQLLYQADGDVNLTALSLGIVIAVVSIVLAAGLAAYCMKRRNNKDEGAGHRQVTSFENPVYEYEQNLK